MLCPSRHSALTNILPYPSYRLSRHTTMPTTHPYPLCYSTCYTILPVRPPVHYFALPVVPPYLSFRNARHTAQLVMPPYLTYHLSCSIIAPHTTLSVILPYPLPHSACGTALNVVQPYLWLWWWSQTPARGPPSFSPHTSSSVATPTGSVHKSQTVCVVGMSGQLKRCNESWFGSLQSGQFAAGWLAGSILCW